MTNKWAAPLENVSSGIPDQGLHYPLTESLNTAQYINGEIWYFAHAQDDVNLQISCTSKETIGLNIILFV